MAGRAEFIVRSKRVVFPEGETEGAIHIKDGKVLRTASGKDAADALAASASNLCPLFDENDKVIMPGIVDSHVHLNEPGRTLWEGFDTGSRAAAAGGLTTIVDMPLNAIPPTTTVENFHTKLRAAEGQLWVDVGFLGGVIPGNSADLRPLVQAGILGFKCFLCHSGVDEFPGVEEKDLHEALEQLKGTGSLLMFHAEVTGPIDRACAALQPIDEEKARKYSTYLHSRPREAENEAISMVLRLCREYGVRCHIVHLSSSDVLPWVEASLREGIQITVETCTHYLYFSSEEVPDGATHFKCAPPIREAENREKLWEGIRKGLIQLVVSDHSPCTPDLKILPKGDFCNAWGGISSLQLSLSAFWTEASRRGLTLMDLVRLKCTGSAQLVGLDDRKGALREGMDADFIVWDPEATFVVDQTALFHKNKLCPYNGRELKGVVQKTYVRGNLVWSDGAHAGSPVGRPLFGSRHSTGISPS